MIPKIGLVVCNSNASNTGAITAMAALEIIKEHNNVGILSLSALTNKIPRQMALTKKIERILVIDGCHNECAKNILNDLGMRYDAYLNLERDLEIKKIGPFSTMLYTNEDVEKVKKVIEEMLDDDKNAD